MTEKQKIIHYLEVKRYTKSSFYKKTGFSHGFLDRGESIGVDNARIILKAYPDLNITWFIMNEGEMLISSGNFNTIPSKDIKNDVFVKSVLKLVENSLDKRLSDIEDLLYKVLGDMKAKEIIEETNDALKNSEKLGLKDKREDQK